MISRSMCRKHPILVLAVVLVFLPVTAVAQVKADEPIKTTICGLLKEPAQFNGKMVQVRGTVVSSFESGGLRDSSCLAYLQSGDNRFPALSGRTGEYAFFGRFEELRHPNRLKWRSIQLPPPIRRVEDESYNEFGKLVRQNFRQPDGNICFECPLFEITVTVVSRFDHLESSNVAIRANRKEKPAPYNAGFGHLNASLNRLVWQSVSDVVAKPIDPSVYEKENSGRRSQNP